MPGTTDTVKTILTPGEFVIRKEAVDMVGVPMLNMINNMPEKGGHSNIDKLIEMATTANMKGMYGGGMVNAGPKPMGTGGMVDAYAGGGMVMNQYGHGGMVKKKMMGYGHGGMVKNKMMNYGHGGMVKDKMMMMEKGGQLKPVPKDNPGLGKLPEMVRNRMGYMQMGGMVDDSLMGMMGGGMAMKKKMMGMQDGGMIGPFPDPQMFADEQNRQLEQSIDQRMANPNVYRGSVLGAVRDTTMMLQDSIDQDTENKALKTLELMRLKGMLGDSESIEMQAPPMPNNQMADSMRVRDLRNLIGLEVMRRGAPAVMQGIGPDFNEILK
tara:strand:- start:8 stop:979 length:972 start_codon:yes stop_codon:yes gene_type:complete